MRARIILGLAAALLATAGPGRSETSGLTDDGRVGVVADLQGTVLLRPAGRQRWSPVGARTVLLPGDQLRTILRGAHAAEVRLAHGGSLVLGAGGLVRLEERGKIRLVRGDAEFTGAEKKPVRVTGPGGFDAAVTATVVLRAKDDATTELEKTPRWLEGYRGSTTDDWMGSLVANVDGRNVSLSVGYHKVNVVIRDQIAVTTVEESFVNSTDRILEGVFSFPLPAGASISGFGMWVGGELVEADIIERQRARQIYEDILRRRKDPGLLEWSGGNLFKASVFPIPAHGEKRIRVRYTQVLPLEGSRMRYRYALRSELLRTNPLRHLQIRVMNHSSAAIESASSPTHDVTVTQTENDATLEFSAQEYTPDRDFEVVFGLKRTSPLGVVPHRRGEDGYFMLLLAPPDASAGAWQRELVPEGDPLDILFVVDTSGSMGPAERKAQREFLESALALLGPDDRFRLMACDATIAWPVKEPLSVTDAHVEQALTALDRRFSLGWSDLDLALSTAASAASAGTLVVYVGDGIGTTGDADPVALAQRIQRMQVPAGVSFHAVATGSAYEEGVLDAIATLGGGSSRGTNGAPARAAYSLLAEVAQPPVKDLRVTFEGLRTARVYPERLPSLPAGTQQIVLGRFLPEGGAQQRGTVTVTGTVAGRPVRYTADLTIAESEDGNSFLPRLWARKHLDALLAEGRTPEIRDEIVSFSERFGIMTPYTSFLVLESDEDRERYGVARRVHMRDGERFFAEARTNAATAALREQVKKARSWRLGLQRRMLAEIADLGRGLYTGAYAYADGDRGGDGARQAAFQQARSGAYRGPAGKFGDPVIKDSKTADFNESDDEGSEAWDVVPPDSRDPSDPPPPSLEPAPVEEMEFAEGLDRAEAAKAPMARRQAFRPPGGPQGGARASRERSFDSVANRADGYSRDFRPWFGTLLFQRFPPLPPPAPRPPASDDLTWDADVTAVLETVSAPLAVPSGVAGGVEITFRQGARGPAVPQGLLSFGGRGLIAPERWFTRTLQLGQEPQEHWLAEQRGALTAGTRLGRRRAGTEEDRDDWGALVGRSRIDYTRTYAKWDARIVSREGSLVVIRLTPPGEGDSHRVLTIDTNKNVVVRHDTLNGEKLASSRRAGGFVLAGGLWWPTEETTVDGEGRETWRKTSTVRELSAEELDTAFAAALKGQGDVIFLGPENPEIAPAKQAVHDGEGGFAEYLAIASDHAQYQRWDEAWEAWETARAQLAGKPGADWIEVALYAQSRRGEKFVAHVRRMGEWLSRREGPEIRAMAWSLFHATQSFHGNERLDLMDALEHAGTAGADAAEAQWWRTQWSRQRATLLFSAARHDEAIAIWRRLWEERPEDPQTGVDLLSGLARIGRVDDVLELLAAVDPSGWPNYQIQNLFQQLAGVLWNAMRFEDLLKMAERWIALQPATTQAYHVRLTTLLALERVEECDAWVGQHLGAAAEAGEDPDARARLAAAVATALGDEWNGRWYQGQVDEKWARSLAVVARTLARDEQSDANIVSRIVQHHRYRPSDAHRELLSWLREDFAADDVIESLPAIRVMRYQTWLAWDRNSVDAAVWRGVTDRVTARWRTAEDLQERRALFNFALALRDAHLESAEAVELLREALATDVAEDVPSHVGMLLLRLIQLPWTSALEDECLALMPRVVVDDAPDAQKTQQFASYARWLADRLLAMRVEAGLGPVAERERLPRADLRARQRAAKAQSRKGLAERLGEEMKGAPDLLRPWYEIERICFLAELGEDPQAVEGEAREMLLSIATDEHGERWVLRERSVLALSYLAVRRNAPEGLADRVVALLRRRLEEDAEALDWRHAIFRLLVALDRPAELETALREWIVPSQVDSRWRIALGYLMAEMERLEESVAQFEEVARLGELGESQYVTLADWYLVLGDETRRQDTLDRRYRVVDENQLANRVYQEYYRLQRADPGSGVPPDLDEEILRVIRVLFVKTTRPDARLNPVRNLYQLVKDFRLLAAIADGVIGHTPEAIYPFLRSSGGILQEVHEEATCDEIRLRLAERLSSAKTDTDRRGMRLLMAQVERRAAEVLDQPGPHVQLSLQHLREARKGEWLPGERRLMAEYLASLGKIPHQVLADEQLSQLRELHRLAARGTVDRVRIARFLYVTEWIYDKRDTAIDGLTAALDEYRQARGGVLPAAVNDIVDLLTGWYESVRKFGTGESLLLAERERQSSAPQKQWYTRRLFTLYVNCLRHGGTVSHGAGADLYRAARGLMERALADHSPDLLAEILGLYCQLHRTAHDPAKVKGVGSDLVRFSRTLLPELLPRFGQQQARQVRQVAEAIHDIAGPLPALTLLVEHLEVEPAWFRRRHADAWRTYSHRMAQWRTEMRGRIGDLEPRLLAVVVRELERDLLSQQSRSRSLYGNPNDHNFWKEKAGDFADVARRVIRDNPHAAGILHHTAHYLWSGLELRDEAIQTLLDADQQSALHQDGRWTLLGWLQHEKRWQDALPQVERLVAEWPDNIEYRLPNIRILHELGRDDQGKALVDATRAHFAELGNPARMGPRSDERLADMCLLCGYYTRAVELFEIAIPNHERRMRGQRRGAGDGHLASMYGSLARAHAGLQQFDEAVDAASAAVVVWGPSNNNRAGALDALQKVLQSIPDLPAWTDRYEKEAAESGLDAPVIRRALAAIHLSRKEPAPALRHLRVALRHTPDDVELHASVVRAYTMQKDDAAAYAAMANSLAHVPAQPDLYARLAAGLRKLGDEDGAERAVTGLAEYAPNEADGHRRLAKIRARSGQHTDAVVQWRQVVRIRSLELDGWLELARAQARSGDREGAHATLDELLATDWGPAHRKAIEAVSKAINGK